jgi:DNA-binding PadR family transcriptional regulator
MVTRVLANYEIQGPHVIPATRTRLTEPIKRLYGGTTSTDRRAIRRLVEQGVIDESPASDGERDERAYRLSKTGKDAIVKCLLILAVSIGIHVRIE